MRSRLDACPAALTKPVRPRVKRCGMCAGSTSEIGWPARLGKASCGGMTTSPPQTLLRIEHHILLSSTAIELSKYRVPSAPRSQPQCRPASTIVGDQMGILGAVVLALPFWERASDPSPRRRSGAGSSAGLACWLKTAMRLTRPLPFTGRRPPQRARPAVPLSPAC